jgi:hypothetical protein
MDYAYDLAHLLLMKGLIRLPKTFEHGFNQISTYIVPDGRLKFFPPILPTSEYDRKMLFKGFAIAMVNEFRRIARLISSPDTTSLTFDEKMNLLEMYPRLPLIADDKMVSIHVFFHTDKRDIEIKISDATAVYTKPRQDLDGASPAPSPPNFPPPAVPTAPVEALDDWETTDHQPIGSSESHEEKN